MADLLLHGRSVPTVFDLLGHDENDMTYALGWGLARNAAFLRAFGERIAPGVRLTEPAIALQRFDTDDRGYTDIELTSLELHAIVEAKRGWWLPSADQLDRYVARFTQESRDVQRVVVLTQIGAEEVVRHALGEWTPPPPASAVVLGWGELVRLAREASHHGPLYERRIAAELASYLRGVADMRDIDSNSVYVVSLGAEAWPDWGDLTPIRVVESANRYFYPASGKNWPKLPPNYIGFRYWGRLQSIHHVDDYVISDRPLPDVPGAPDLPWTQPHYILRLGPAIRPDHVVRTGSGIQRSRRTEVDIDLLLTSSTISEAETATRRRRSE